jgi:predicted enzyme related to lactoylglutathione lyase
MLRQAMLLVRDIRLAVDFYGPNGLGLPLRHSSDTWAELGSEDASCSLALKLSTKEAELTKAFSPILCFDVADVDVLLPSLLLKGAILDGGVRREVYGTFAALKTPDGAMIGLRQAPGAA